MPAANAKFLKNMGVDLDIVSNHVEIYKSKTNPVKLSKAEIRDL